MFVLERLFEPARDTSDSDGGDSFVITSFTTSGGREMPCGDAGDLWWLFRVTMPRRAERGVLETDYGVASTSALVSSSVGVERRARTAVGGEELERDMAELHESARLVRADDGVSIGVDRATGNGGSVLGEDAVLTRIAIVVVEDEIGVVVDPLVLTTGATVREDLTSGGSSRGFHGQSDESALPGHLTSRVQSGTAVRERGSGVSFPVLDGDAAVAEIVDVVGDVIGDVEVDDGFTLNELGIIEASLFGVRFEFRIEWWSRIGRHGFWRHQSL
ncbi:hypothetical protein [Halobellus rufus]|uniref:hypothetical protein n=1 Tax=Halobellus rufus TaxID=1448860 RepID=UPI000678BF54|nr:hypothetical protein [Halobellus rufus]